MPEFKGDKLLLIIARQGSPVQAMDGYGNLERTFQNPTDALKLIATGGYIGIGHAKRIRYIRPEDPEHHRVPWASISQIAIQLSAERRRNKAEHTGGFKKWTRHEKVRLRCSAETSSSHFLSTENDLRYEVVNVCTGETVAVGLLQSEAYRLRDSRQDEAFDSGADLSSARFAVRCAV